jgi:hypothetical protein
LAIEEPANRPVPKISLLTLLTRPTDFNGLVIEIEGFVSIAPENAVVYISSEARRFALSTYGIWLNTSKLTPDEIKRVNGRCCRVTGRFESGASGPSNAFVGKLGLQSALILEEDAVLRRDNFLKELGYVEYSLSEGVKKLSKEEAAELEKRRKYLQDILDRIRDEKANAR